MKSILLFAALFPVILFAQKTTAGDFSQDKDLKYVQVFYAQEGKMENIKNVAIIDWGRKIDAPAYVIDDSGGHRFWLSPVELFNYMAQFGWELVLEYRPPITPVKGFPTIAIIYTFRRQ